MKEIVFITHCLGKGGAERVTSVLANELAAEEKGYKVTVLFTRSDEIAYDISENVNIEYIFETGNKVRKLLGKMKNLRTYIRNHPQAAYVVMLPYETFYTWLAMMGLKRNLVYSLRNDPLHPGSRMASFVNRIIYPGAKKIVFQTKDARAFFKKRKKGWIIVPNPLSDHLPDPYYGKRSKEIVTVGRLTEQKNYPMLLRSFAQIHAKYPDWKLSIYGAGELELKLKELVVTLNVEKAVDFKGFQTDVLDKIITGGMFVMASDYEGISNAMLEALAIGMPVICTDCPAGGAAMCIKDRRNGRLVPVGGEQELTDAMLEYIENPDFAVSMGKAAVGIRKKFETEKIVSAWEKLLWS